MDNKSNVIRDKRMADRGRAVHSRYKRSEVVDEVASRGRVLDLASFLGLDSRVIADVLVEAIDRDPVLKHNPGLHHAA